MAKPEKMSSREFQAKHVPEYARKTTWSNAKPTVCRIGHRHASQMEARVCGRLTQECDDFPGLGTLYQQARIPLWTLAPGKNDRPLYLTVDFVIVKDGKMVRAIDAKAKGRISRDWRRGAAAFEATYGIKIEEVDK